MNQFPAYVVLPAETVDRHLASASGIYVKVLLAVLRRQDTDPAPIAGWLSLSEADVREAIGYWIGCGVLPGETTPQPAQAPVRAEAAPGKKPAPKKPHSKLLIVLLSILLAAITGVFAMILGIFVARPFLVAMSCPENVLDLATEYMRIYFVGVPFSLLYNFGAAILRAHGDTKRPMNILAVSGLINVGLNMVFVIFCGMDVDGVGWATVISQLYSASMVLWYLFRDDGGYDLNLREMKLHKRELASVARVGIPCGLNGLVFSIANVIIASSINSLGEVAVGGNSAAGGISGIVYQVLAAFYSGCISFSGQCYGAGKYKRIDKLVASSIIMSGLIMAVLSLIATLFPHALLGLFTKNEAYIQSGAAQMQIVCWSYILYGVSESFLGCLRGMRRSGMPTLLNALFICVPRLVWVFVFFPMCRETWFLHLCYPISYVFSSAAQGLYYLAVRRKLDKESEETAIA